MSNWILQFNSVILIILVKGQNMLIRIYMSSRLMLYCWGSLFRMLRFPLGRYLGIIWPLVWINILPIRNWSQFLVLRTKNRTMTSLIFMTREGRGLGLGWRNLTFRKIFWQCNDKKDAFWSFTFFPELSWPTLSLAMVPFLLPQPVIISNVILYSFA